MLQRIGSQKPTIFGTVDFAQAYHQAALTLATKKHTSFILYSGVYQVTRLPFGLKQAPSHFQEMIATEVLNTLLYRILEIYIDDVKTTLLHDYENSFLAFVSIK